MNVQIPDWTLPGGSWRRAPPSRRPASTHSAARPPLCRLSTGSRSPRPRHGNGRPCFLALQACAPQGSQNARHPLLFFRRRRLPVPGLQTRRNPADIHVDGVSQELAADDSVSANVQHSLSIRNVVVGRPMDKSQRSHLSVIDGDAARSLGPMSFEVAGQQRHFVCSAGQFHADLPATARGLVERYTVLVQHGLQTEAPITLR